MGWRLFSVCGWLRVDGLELCYEDVDDDDDDDLMLRHKVD